MAQDTSTQSNDAKAGLAGGIASLNLYQKLAHITGEVGKIEKTGQSSGYGDRYNFIEYGAVAARLRDLFSKYGVVIVPRMVQAAKQQRVDITSSKGTKGTAVLIDFSFCVVNADKPDDKFTVSWTGEAADYGDKATNKAATAALKYYLMRQFNISEKGDDPDGETPEIASKSVETVLPVMKPASEVSNAVTYKQLTKMNIMFKELGIEDRDERLSEVAAIIGHKIQSSTELTKSEGMKVIDRLTALQSQDNQEERTWRE